MKQRMILVAAVIAVSMFLASSVALAAPGANLLYWETDSGGGLWQYDYTFYNTSDAGEALAEVFLYFDPPGTDRTVTGLPLPAGWDDVIWEGANETDYLNTYSDFDMIAAGSSLGGFSFTIDYQAGDISYDAVFDDFSSITGTTALVPEPISSMLFLSGGAALGFRRCMKG